MPKYKIEPMFGPGFMIVNTDLDDVYEADIPTLEEAEKKLEELNAADKQ